MPCTLNPGEKWPMAYRPWIGKKYCGGFRCGLKLLIIGESPYDDQSDDALTTWTERYIDGVRSTFRSGVARVVEGRQLTSKEERRAFWERVAHANHCQVMMEDAKARPTPEQLHAGRASYKELFTALRPDLCFVFSKRTWEYMPDDLEFPGSHDIEVLRSPHTRPVAAYMYTTDNKRRVLAACFNHPRGLTVPSSVWHGWSESVLQHAPALLEK